MAIDLDALIIGGGIQGLFLLNDFTKLGLSAFLLTKDKLGVGQTLHSHVYIHQGYLYSEASFAKRLAAVRERWNSTISELGLSRPNVRSIFGFVRGTEDLLLRRWKQSGLKHYAGDVHSIFSQGVINGIYNTDEVWLDGEELIAKLSSGVRDLIRIGLVSRIETNQKRFVHACIGTKDFVFCPRVLVLAAGSGNASLLQMVANEDNDFARRLHREFGVLGPQRLRRSQMLVLRSKRLPRFACILPHLTLFSVCRKDLAGNVWLVSFGVDEEVGPELISISADPPVDHDRVVRGINALQAVAPQIFEQKDLQIGVYTGYKAEGYRPPQAVQTDLVEHKIPKEEVIEYFGTDDVVAVWPTKLTLAPRASKEIVSRTDELIMRSSNRSFDPSIHGIPPSMASVGTEKWKSVSCLAWATFKAELKKKTRVRTHE
jgi:glycine/D-amino acid oxidase-like deaminating enzyme